MLKYCQKSLNGCVFSSLLSSLASILKTKDRNAILFRIEEYLRSEVGNCIDFDNAIFRNEKQLKAKKECIIALGNIKRWSLLIF